MSATTQMLVLLAACGVIPAALTFISLVVKMRPFKFQIKKDADTAIRDLEIAFAAAQDVISRNPNAPQAVPAQEILDYLASGNLKAAQQSIVEDPQSALAQATTGMLNVEGAVRFLAHDTAGKFIDIPGEVSDLVKRLLHDSMNPTQ